MSLSRLTTTRFWRLAYFASVVILFLIVHLTVNRIEWLLDLWTSHPVLSRIPLRTDLIVIYAPLLKAILFTASILIIAMPGLLNIAVNFRAIPIRELWPPVVISLVTIIVLGILVFNPGTEHMGTQYARLAHSPFAQKANWFNTRLLMPALGYFLFLRGEWPYYVFSLVLTLMFIALLHTWNEEHHIGLSLWQFISLCTCSFVIFQFQKGGYPDILVFIFFLLVMQKSVSQDAKLSFLLLALLAHESSIFLGLVLAWRYLDHKNLLQYVGILVLYGVVWVLFSRIDLPGILTSHNVNDRAGWEWVLREPLREIFGVLVSYKAVWILAILAIATAWQKRLNQDLLFILGCIAMGILMTILGVDTARMMSFAFPGFLIALQIMAEHLESGYRQRLFNMVFLLNLLIPSVYVGLVGNVDFAPGLYRMIYAPLAALFTG